LLNDDVPQTGLQRPRRGCSDHERINVERKDPADGSLRERDGERTVAATELDGIPAYLATA
jgi:hypothetical protein